MEQERIQEALTNITTAVATSFQQRVAYLFQVLLALVVGLSLPVDRQQWIGMPPFLATFTTFAFFADLVTACLLLGQFLALRIPALAILAGSYLFSALIIPPYVLTFPGIYTSTGLLGANPQTASWLWVLWHTGFPLGLLLYTWATQLWGYHASSPRFAFYVLLGVIGGVFLLFFLGIGLAFFWSLRLPTIIEQNHYTSFTWFGVGPVLIGLNLLVVVAIHLLPRPSTILHMWLRITALAFCLDVFLSIYGGSRFSIGWYLARFNSMIASSIVLAILLFETLRLYRMLKQQHDELKKHYQVQQDFISMMNHEFRTALTSIEGFSEMIRDELTELEEIKEFACDISAAAHRLHQFIGRLVELEQMGSGEYCLTLQPLQINTLLLQLAQECECEGHALHVSLDPELPAVLADREALRQALRNILENAFKYAPAHKIIEISSRREGQQLHVLICDQGQGIPPEDLEAVFDPYHRVETRSSYYVSGSGLGLPLVRRILLRHHGQVWAESVPGKGATFHLVLPVLSAQPVKQL